MSSSRPLAGKSIVITGAGRGLGASYARCVTDADDVAELIRCAQAAHGTLDGIVNNAAIQLEVEVDAARGRRLEDRLPTRHPWLIDLGTRKTYLPIFQYLLSYR
jgi:NAD(P)-dependent dehydrogenase (short-subunit alcohol dehydrogenase family)